MLRQTFPASEVVTWRSLGVCHASSYIVRKL
nr:MAG TPA: hypothetical protein [Caudoviricetes sp.]